MKIAVVTPMMKSGETGGAEALYAGLVENLRAANYDAEQVEVVIDESSFKAVLDSYLRCADLDVSAFDLVISTKAPTYMVRHPNHISYLLHTIRVFYDMFEREYGAGTPELHEQRRMIHALDQFALDPKRVRAHFTNGAETYKRLLRADPFWHQINFRAVHHPPALSGYKEPAGADYVFLPSRLHRWKRVQLLIDAYKHLDIDLPLKISGTGENEAELKALAGSDSRIEFLGRVSEPQLIDLYARALVVPFVPVNEDYGLITIEAFKSKKPVITCTDSGEPVQFVRNFETGFVVDPDPKSIAGKIRYLAERRSEAAEMGRRGFDSVSHISWPSLIATMLEGVAAAKTKPSPRPAVAAPSGNGSSNGAYSEAPRAIVAQPPPQPRKVVIVDMQPIDPPAGGGRMRLLGLYHGLGVHMPAVYIGSYDWPGPPYRRHNLSPTLEEIDVPLSPEHFAAAKQLQEETDGKNVIDVAFHLLAKHSPEFLRAAREHVAAADVVVFSHPWIYPIVKDVLRRDSQLVVYDSQNVEGYLRCVLLDDGGKGTELVKEVARVERELCQEADLVLACSHEDRLLFHDLYGIPRDKIAGAPNGTFTKDVPVANPTRRKQAKEQLEIGTAPVAIFLGSAYGPNIEAGRFIVEKIAPRMRHVVFTICGDVGPELEKSEKALPRNVRITGRLTNEDKATYFAAADVAVNPIFSGSGTNVKMFDFMAHGLPTITTATGARGITLAENALIIAQPQTFAAEIERIIGNPGKAAEIGAAARSLVEQKYSWERISATLGGLFGRLHSRLSKRRPFFSVVVASYDRHDRLSALLESLRLQNCTDFEVIIVDQSEKPWANRGSAEGLDVHYIHTDIKGAVNARNTGALYARGEVIAFTDDDCQPLFSWLESAIPYFADPGTVGVEGIIMSDKWDDPNFRAVTNVGLQGEGFMTEGFMTANLFIRREIFAAIDGFDERFDHPHFREDTDLGWRAQEHGRIPFAQDVCVYHPPQARQVAREGLAERNRFFEKDALLLKKHPERYRSLFLKEAHYAQTPGFREHFLRGAEKYQVEVDDYIKSFFAN